MHQEGGRDPAPSCLALLRAGAASLTEALVGEYARTLGPLAFPWGALGYTWLPTPLVQAADLGGWSLLSLVTTGTAAALAAFVRGHRWPLVTLTGVIVVGTVYGTTRSPLPQPDQTALIVQGAVPPLEKAVKREGAELNVYLDLTRRAWAAGRVDLVAWPESASPFPPTDPETLVALTELRVPLVTGAPTQEGRRYWNSAYAVEGQVTGRYDKVHPVPFGEFLPWRQALTRVYDPVLGLFGLRHMQGVTPGTSYRPLSLRQLQVGAYISYESVFAQAARTLTARGARVLAHLSNDAWFEGTAGKEQHFQMGRLRAIETRRYVLRASNDGISGVIDPLGQVTVRFPEGTRGAFRASFGEYTDLTPYVHWGDWPVVLAGLLWGAAVVLGQASKGRRSTSERRPQSRANPARATRQVE
ncbi:apolipoprotein N-acyltransferase [Deinococcus wulumuqiensis]|uniref:apolipoprotein N-acyltransferase n=1 Tax=Deinococcus wulumuqiensis TaxID=980427 RepID=UPI0030B8978C